MDQKAMMEMMMKLAAPGEMHKNLEPFAGTFNTSASMWMAPGAPAEVTKGTAHNSWILGGRFLEQRYDGTFMKQAFHGIGYTGYDNLTKKYVGLWMDDMGTAVMVSEGKMDDANNWSFVATMPDPMSGKMTEVKEKLILKDHDHHMFEMWVPGPDGQPFKTMSIEYVRAKAAKSTKK